MTEQIKPEGKLQVVPKVTKPRRVTNGKKTIVKNTNDDAITQVPYILLDGTEMSIAVDKLMFLKSFVLTNNRIKSYQATWPEGSTTLTSIRSYVGELLRREGIAEVYTDLIERKLKRFDVTEERMLEELSIISLSNIAYCYADDGSLLPIKQIPEPLQRCIKEYNLEKGIVKFYDKLQALASIATLKKLTEDKPTKIVITNGRGDVAEDATDSGE